MSIIGQVPNMPYALKYDVLHIAEQVHDNQNNYLVQNMMYTWPTIVDWNMLNVMSPERLHYIVQILLFAYVATNM